VSEPTADALPPVILPSTDDTIASLRAALAGRDAWIAGAVRLLQQLEWSAVWRNQRACPVCGSAIAEHLDDCPLKAALDTAPEPAP
jgi:ribosomal protein S27AE